MSERAATIADEFPHAWRAEILRKPPLIAPARHYVYPGAVEEVERGALQILLRHAPAIAPCLMTFALGFADPSLPHGLWSCPDPGAFCAVAGGYAYVVRADQPERWMQVPYRPVTAIYSAAEDNLLLFVSFHRIWALGKDGFAWETGSVSCEGIRVTEITRGRLKGMGWDLATDAEVEFTVDLATGQHAGGVDSLQPGFAGCWEQIS